MPTIFEVGEKGDTAELILLKERGANLNERDSDGNTVLLTAACHGHLDTVRWLLNSGSAQITEENRAGNTALLLAAAFGHLETVRWLLSAQVGVIVAKQNQHGSTPLLLAIYHGQLPVLDYLIRHHYLSAHFNEKEKEVLHSFSRKKSIRYYLDVYQLFTQAIVNHTELISLLTKASRYLTSTEMSFVYLLCFWMQVRDKKEALRPIGTMTDQSCMRKLSPSLQVELISYLFQEGYILDNWSIHKSQLIITGICLDANQMAAVTSWLINQRESDPVWVSQVSDIKKNNLYVNYYLKPLYTSLIHAFRTNDPEKILSALSAPRTYHLRSTVEPISEDSIAKWTAYHLCQQRDISEKEHQAAYARLSDKSRLGYYHTVKKYLNDPAKMDLLFNLGSLPASNGERLYWVEEYPTWLEGIRHQFSAQQNTPQRLVLIGLDQPIPLPEEMSLDLWDKITHKPQPLRLPGNHPVYHLKAGQLSLYWKLYPSLPGINDALQYLYRRTFGATGGLPWSVAGLLHIDNQTIPVLLSEDVGAPIESNDLRLNQLNPYALSKLILFTILTNTEDGKRENLALKINSRGLYDIYSVDNDQGLVEPITESDFFFFKTKKLAVKSYLFCLDAMNISLDATAVTELLALNPMETLSAWLQDLIQLNAQYEVLFEKYKAKAMQEKNLFRRSYLQMVLPVATVLRIAYKLQRLQEILRINSHTSPLQLLKTLEPDVAHYYEPVLLKHISATERFDQLVKEGHLYGWCSKTKTYSTSTTSGRDVYQSLVPDNEAEVVTPQIALRVLEQVHQQWAKIHEEQVEVMRGEVVRLSQLPLKDQQAMLKLTQLNQYPAKKRTLFLEALARRTDFTEIYLRYPEASLTESVLATLLKNNIKLRYLSLTSANRLTSLTALNQLPSLTKLKLALLPQVEAFTVALPNLTELILKDNRELTTLRLDAPQLHSLYITNCPNLETLDLPMSLRLVNVSIQDCTKLPLADFYARWPGFLSRWSDVPRGFRQRLADCISQSFIEPTLILPEAVYEIVTQYLNELRQLVQILLLAEVSYQVWSTAYTILTHVGYDHPSVVTKTLSLLKYSNYSPNYQIAIDAAYAMVKLQLRDEPVVEKLLKMLNCVSPFVRVAYTAAQVFGKLCIKDERAIVVLLNRLKDKDAFVRTETAEALGALKIKDERIIRGLLDILEYDNAVIARIEAARALGVLQVKEERVIRLLLKLLESKSRKIEVIAAYALSALQVEDHRVNQTLLKALKSDISKKKFEISENAGFWVCHTAVNSLGKLQVIDRRILQALLDLLQYPFLPVYKDDYPSHDLTNLCEAVAQTMSRLQVKDETLIKALLKLVEHGHQDFWIFSTKALGELQVKDDRIIQILLKRGLENNMTAMKALCVWQVQQDERVTQWLLKKLEKHIIWLISPSPPKHNFLQTLLKLYTLDPRHDDYSISMDSRVFDCLAILKVNDRPLFQMLLEMLQHKDKDTCMHAITLVTELKIRDKQVIQAILTSLLVNCPLENLEESSIYKHSFLYYFQQPDEALKPQFAELLGLQKQQVGLQPLVPEIIEIAADPDIPIENASPALPVDACLSRALSSSVARSEEVKEDKTTKNPLLLAVERGDLDSIKQLLNHKNGIKVSAKSQHGNTALSIAARHGFLPIVDYLIRYYYLASNFDKKEKEALDLFSKNNVFHHYFDVFNLFSENSTNIKAMESLLDIASKQLNRDELSFIYLIYLWMQIHHRANNLLNPFENEPCIQQHQLLPEHQSELIAHMIREGLTLDNWSITIAELVIEDQMFDEKQGKALEKLLEQSEHDLCVMSPQIIIQKNVVYVEMMHKSSLQYTVVDLTGEIKVDEISKDDLLQLGCRLIAPLTLDQLHPFSAILKMISDKNNILPELQILTFNKVRFTKEYRLLTLPPPDESILIAKNTLYIRYAQDFINYVVLSPLGKKETGKISKIELLNIGFVLDASLPLRQLKPFLLTVLAITSQKKHTLPASCTQGYKTFLNLLKNQRLMPRLQSLNLQDCDLWDDWDLCVDDWDLSVDNRNMDLLIPALAQRTTLRHLNLDNNHVTKNGVKNILKLLFQTPEYLSKLTSLSVRFNKIEITSPEELEKLEKQASKLEALHLEGNMIIESNTPMSTLCKREHSKRATALEALFSLLSLKDASLTIDMFLMATQVGFNDEEGQLRLKLDNESIIDVALNASALNSYEKLCFQQHIEGQKNIRKYREVFPYLKESIQFVRAKIPRELRETTLDKSSKKVCKQLLSFHCDARLKGRLTTHRIFSSRKIQDAPSFLFPDARLTLNMGWVYLIEKKEHVRLVYEYLTGYGQRGFHIAELLKNNDSGMPFIRFEKKDIEQEIQNLHRGHQIAKFQAATKRIKNMHVAIQHDVVLNENLDKPYQKVIFGSSQNHSVQNCLIYCLRKMKDYLDISIQMDRLDVLPSTVVGKLVKIQTISELQNRSVSLPFILASKLETGVASTSQAATYAAVTISKPSVFVQQIPPPSIVEFSIVENTAKQLGWNCFDVAVGLPRERLVAFALEQKVNPAYRKLLAPEIRMAAGITAVLMNMKLEEAGRDATAKKERIAQLAELFNLLDVVNEFGESGHKAIAMSNIHAVLSQPILQPSDSHGIHDMRQQALPEAMQTEELRQLVSRYNDAHEAIKPKVRQCNDFLGHRERSILPYANLVDFFANSEHCEAHREAHGLFLEIQQQFLPYEQAFFNYCENETVYEAYLTHYYGKQQWITFQPSNAAQRPEDNTSIIDIAARCLNRQIIVHQMKGDQRAEVYHTVISYNAVPEDSSLPKASAAATHALISDSQPIHIQYNGRNHFVELRSNFMYQKEVQSELLKRFGVFSLTSSPMLSLMVTATQNGEQTVSAIDHLPTKITMSYLR